MPQIAMVLGESDVDSHFERHSDAAWTDLPSHIPVPSGRCFDEGDRRLASAAGALALAEDTEIWLVTDDEDFLLNLAESEIDCQLGIYPVASGRLMLYLFDCGAITADELEAMLFAEQERIDSDPTLQDRKRVAKQGTLDDIAVRLAIGGA